MEILLGALVIALFIMLIMLVLASAIFSIAIGIFISIFTGVYSAVKSCVIGIKDNVDNMFVKVLMFIVIGLFILCLITVIVWFVLGLYNIDIFCWL